MVDLVKRAREALEDLQRLFDETRNYAAPLHLNVAACDLGKVWRDAWTEVLAPNPHCNAQLEENTGGLDLGCEAARFGWARSSPIRTHG